MIEKVWKPLGFLIIFIILCAITARLISRGETLTDYAQENPETAYATPDRTPFPTLKPAAALAPGAAPEASSSSLSGSEPESSPAPSPDAEPEESSAPQTADMAASPDTVYYRDGFSYQPLSEEVIGRITGISYPVRESEASKLSVPALNIVGDDEELPISYEQLRYLSVLYYDFNGEVQTGELICNVGLAQDMVEIFYELFQNEYQIEKIRLIDEYDADDDASMLDNNTSCFNYRVVDGTSTLSKHALGCAIDINPFYNPYVVYNKNGNGQDYICPEGSEPYADRSQNFPYKIDTADLCYRLFTEHGFIWGGNWNSCKDYQHFQKVVKK